MLDSWHAAGYKLESNLEAEAAAMQASTVVGEVSTTTTAAPGTAGGFCGWGEVRLACCHVMSAEASVLLPPTLATTAATLAPPPPPPSSVLPATGVAEESFLQQQQQQQRQSASLAVYLPYFVSTSEQLMSHLRICEDDVSAEKKERIKCNMTTMSGFVSRRSPSIRLTAGIILPPSLTALALLLSGGTSCLGILQRLVPARPEGRPRHRPRRPLSGRHALSALIAPPSPCRGACPAHPAEPRRGRSGDG